MRGLTSIPEGFNPTVGGSLDLRGLTSIPEGFNPTVGSSLYLEELTSIPEGFNPTVGGFLDLEGLTSIPEGFNPTVGGFLDLEGLTSIPEGFNPTVGGSLYLRGLTSIPEGFNPTVGGSLYLRGLTSIPEGFNPTVGGFLNLEGLTSATKPAPSVLIWEDGRFVSVDGILSEVVGTRGAIRKTRRVGKSEIEFIVSEGDVHAHGETIAEAKESLLYKLSSRDPSEYEGLEGGHTFTKAEAIVCYRVITGACALGVKRFLSEKVPADKIEFSINEMKEITEGAFGSQKFKEFFK